MTHRPHLLVATDLSDASRRAIARALQLARATSVPITALHVVRRGLLDQLRAFLGQDEAVEAQLLQQLENELLAFVGDVAASEGAAEREGVEVEARVTLGAPAVAIARAADQGARAIVLGAHGEGGLKGQLVGSTAARVARVARQPVLVVRHTPRGAYRSILVGVDFSPSAVAALRCTRELAPGAELVLVHALDTPFEAKLRYAGVDDASLQRYREDAEREARSQLEAFAVDAGLRRGEARLIVLAGDPARVLLERQEALEADLVVVGSRGMSPAEEWLLGSVAERVIELSQRDVLVVDPSATQSS